MSPAEPSSPQATDSHQDVDEIDEVDEIETSEEPTQSRSGRTWKRTTHKWTRWLHVYTSMISLLLVLFFGITGITLNHPDWTFGADPVQTTTTGQLPAQAIVDGDVEFLTITQFLRANEGVRGEVSTFSETETEGTVAFKSTGYRADVFFDIESGRYELQQIQQGWLTVLNELHKGRDGTSTWRWIIDISGGLLVALSLTGLGLQFFLRKRRRSALSLAVAGGVLAVILMWITLI